MTGLPPGVLDGAINLEMTDERSMLWGANVSLAYDPPEGAYEYVARKVGHALQDMLDQGWKVARGPDVEEEMDFLRCSTTIRVTVLLRRVT